MGLNKFEVENILVFGESSRPATVTDLEKIVADPTNQYHILRHFPQLPKSYTDTLIGGNYQYFDYAQQKFVPAVISPKDIEIAYQTKGTKFHADVPGIENPLKLIEFIRAELKQRIAEKSAYWIQKQQYQSLFFTINYPVIVGNQDLVPIDSLTAAQRAKIKVVPRGGHQGEKSILIKTIESLTKIPTKRISGEINLIPGKASAFMTAYPSELAPGFPMPNQTEEEQHYNQQFWDQHVFII